jgi:hypothetical protein
MYYYRKYQKSGVRGRTVVQRDSFGGKVKENGNRKGNSACRDTKVGWGGGEKEKEVRKGVVICNFNVHKYLILVLA